MRIWSSWVFELSMLVSDMWFLLLDELTAFNTGYLLFRESLYFNNILLLWHLSRHKWKQFQVHNTCIRPPISRGCSQYGTHVFLVAFFLPNLFTSESKNNSEHSGQLYPHSCVWQRTSDAIWVSATESKNSVLLSSRVFYNRGSSK